MLDYILILKFKVKQFAEMTLSCNTLRCFFKRTNAYVYRYINTENNNLQKNNKLLDGTIACETEYFYKKDRELLERLKRKTQIEVKSMQKQVDAMRNKINEYNRDINENLRFLQDLEKNMTSSTKKKDS